VRRRRHPLFNRTLLGWSGVAAIPLSMIGAFVWLWQIGWFGLQYERAIEGAYGYSADMGLRVKSVLVEGRDRTHSDEIIELLSVERGMPILKIDPHHAKTDLEALPWVSSAAVERQLPDTIYVKIVERRPLTLWQLEGELSVIDQNGVVIPGIEARRHAGLPLIVGPGAPEHAADLISVLASEPELRDRVVAAIWVGDRRWNLQLTGSIDVRLPEGGLVEAWKQLARIEKEYGVLDRDVTLIDLRLPDRLVVRTAPGSELRTEEAREGENT